MPNIEIRIEKDLEQELMLRNGGLIRYREQVFMVSTTVNGKNSYCSLIDLSLGGRCFKEPCSRKTTKQRVANHLRHKHIFNSKDLEYIAPTDYKIQVCLGTGISRVGITDEEGEDLE